MVRCGSIYRETRKTSSKITVDKLSSVSSRSHNMARQVLAYGFQVLCLRTVIRGITAPAAMEAMSDTIMMSVWVLFAYRNNAKNPTLSLGASVCLSIICFSCSLRPEVSVFAPSSDDDTASSFSVSTPLPGGESMLSVAAFAAARSWGAAMMLYWYLEARLSKYLKRM